MARQYLYIGGHPFWANHYFRGTIRDVHIWDRAMSWTEMVALRNETFRSTAVEPPVQAFAALPVAEVETVGIPLASEVVVTGQAPTTLLEKVEFLKSQLGLSGNVTDVVHKAAEQLGVSPDRKALVDLATQCVQILGRTA